MRQDKEVGTFMDYLDAREFVGFDEASGLPDMTDLLNIEFVLRHGLMFDKETERFKSRVLFACQSKLTGFVAIRVFLCKHGAFKRNDNAVTDAFEVIRKLAIHQIPWLKNSTA